MPKAIFKDLKRTRVCGKPLRISRVNLRDGGNPMGQPDVERVRDKSANDRKKPKKNKPRTGGDKPPKRRKRANQRAGAEASERTDNNGTRAGVKNNGGKKHKAKSGSKPKSSTKPKRNKNKGKPKPHKSR